MSRTDLNGMVKQFLAHEAGIRRTAFYVGDVKNEFERIPSAGGESLGELSEGATMTRETPDTTNKALDMQKR